MKPMNRGLAVAAVHCLLACSIAGKYAFDRMRLPRAWVEARMYDPNLPLRGRYLSMQLLPEHDSEVGCSGSVLLSAVNGKLVAKVNPNPYGMQVWCLRAGDVALRDPAPFFLPEHAADPSRRNPGEELWVEVSVPEDAPPRPIRLGVRKNGGPVEPLDVNGVRL